MKKITKILALTSALAIMTAAITGCGKNSGGSGKASYPTKPVQVIIPFAPGGGSDILTRAIMKHIELPNKQNLVAVNVEGASGYIGAQQASNSKNDGYTILAHNPMDLASYSLSETTSTEIYKDMELICNVVNDFNVISTNKATGWKSIDDVLAYIQSHPNEKIKWGVTGSKNTNYADTLRVAQNYKIDKNVTIVPYDGGAASKTALMGGHIKLEMNTASDIRSSVKSGDTVPLLVTGEKRASLLPDVPCTKELGIDITTAKPRGYYAPKGTDKEVIKTLSDAIKKVTENADFKKSVEDLGLEVNFVSGSEMQPSIEGWVDDLRPVFKQILGK